MIMTLLLGSILVIGADMPVGDDTPFLTGIQTAEDFSNRQNDHLTKAQEALNALLGVKGKRTIDNTLKPYDEILIQLDAISNQASLIENVHPDDATRAAAEHLSQKAAAFGSDLSLNRNVYDALASLDVSNADPKTQFYMEKTLRDFRQPGKKSRNCAMNSY